MIFSLKKAVEQLETLCNAHKQVNSYYHGEILDVYKSNKIQHTTVISTFTNAVINPTDITVTMTLLCVDKVLKNNENALEIESNTLQILGDLINFIRTDDSWRYAGVVGSPSSVKIVEKQLDVVNGWSATVSLKLMKDNGVCDVPISPIPQPPNTCDDAYVIINGVTELQIPSGDTFELNVTLDGTPAGTYNEGTQTWEVESEPCPPSEITFTFDNNLIAVVDTSPYNIDCSTTLDVAIITDNVTFNGTYVADGTQNGQTKYVNTLNSNLFIIGGAEWQVVNLVGVTVSQDPPTGQNYPYDADWGGQLTMTQATIEDYCLEPCADATYTIKDSANTTLYSGSIASGGDLQQTITDSEVLLRDSDGNLISTTNVLAQNGAEILAPDGNVAVNGDAYGVVKSNSGIDVLVRYENGTPVGTIVGSVVEIPNPVTPSGIAYNFPMLTGQTTIYRTGDDGWHYAAGTYNRTNPTNPIHVVKLVNFKTLENNNIFGNTDRFTDNLGTQIYTENVFIDHYTKLMWAKVRDFDTFDNSIDSANAYVDSLGNDDYRLANDEEKNSIYNVENNGFNYAPLNTFWAISGSNYHTSTTNKITTTENLKANREDKSIASLKSTGAFGLRVRNWEG